MAKTALTEERKVDLHMNCLAGCQELRELQELVRGKVEILIGLSKRLTKPDLARDKVFIYINAIYELEEEILSGLRLLESVCCESEEK